ncbi:MAG: beta-propeller fold lactonase family protein, partial [Planctomycetota bacterium]
EVALALPAGLALDTATGAITGEPAAASPATVYTITGTGGGAPLTDTLTLEVRDSFGAPRFAYTLDWDGNMARTWRVDAETGSLVAVSTAPTDLRPFRAVPDPLGRFLYVSHFGTGSLAVYRIDQTSGALSLEQLLSVGSAAFELEMAPTGRYLIAGDVGTNALVSFNIDVDTGLVSANPSPVSFNGPSGLTLNAAGDRLFAASLADSRIASFSVDPATGEILAELDSETTPGPVGMALNSAESFLYTANSGVDALTWFTVDQASGDLTRVNSVFSGEEPVSISVDPADDRLSVANLGGRRIESFTINPNGGVVLDDTIDLAGSATNLVQLQIGDALLAPLFEEGLVSTTCFEIASDDLVAGPLQPAGGRASDLTVVATATQATLEPDFVYAGNLTSGDVTPLQWNALSATLDTVGSPVMTGGKPTDVALSLDGEQLFVADQLDDAVVSLDRDPLTGLLSMTGNVGAAGSLTRSVAVAPYGDELFALANDGLTRFGFDAFGVLTEIASAPAGDTPQDIAVAPDGRHVFVANRLSGDISVFAVGTDSLTEIAASPFVDGGEQSERDLALSPDGRLLAVTTADADRVRLYDVDLATGDLAFRQEVAVGDDPRDVEWSIDGRQLYVALYRDSTVAFLDRSLADALSVRGSVVVGDGPIALDVDRSGSRLWIAAFDGDLVDSLGIDGSGNLTRLDSSPIGADTGPAALASRSTQAALE